MSVDNTESGLNDASPLTPDREASSVLLHQIADHAAAAMVVVEIPGCRIVYANRAARRAAMPAPDPLVGRIATEVFAFVEPALLAAASDATARGVAEDKSGTTTWWDVSYEVLDTAAPHTTMLITAVDVTHHKPAGAAAEAAQHTLDALLDYIPQGISISRGPDVHVDRISAQGMALIGRNPEELTGISALQQTDVWEVYRPGSRVPLSPAERPLARATRTGEVTMNETLVVRRADGGTMTVLCNSGPIRDAGGAVTGAVMTWQDASELQRAQAALRESEERLRAVLLQIPAAIFIVDAPDGRVTFKSRLVDELLGNPDSDLPRAKVTLRGWAVHKDGSPYDLAEYPSRRALFQGETVRAEPMTYSRGDGRIIDLEMHAGPVRNKAGEIVAAVAVAMDVTERKRAEARQAFLFGLQESLRTLTAPREILTAAATQLGLHLGAARVGYSEMQTDNQTLVVTNGFADGLPPVNGLFLLSDFGPYHEAQMRQGRTLVYEDVQADERGAQEFGVKLGTRAHVTVALLREDRFIGSLYVTHRKPHKWTPAEVSLIEEVAARIWDASERSRAEAKLRESEERLRLVMDSTGLGYWEYDVVTGATIRSARHEEIFGYLTPQSDTTRERFRTHVVEADRAPMEEGFRRALEQGLDWDMEHRIIRTDGRMVWLKVAARPHFGSDGRVERLIGTVADITQRKQAELTAIETAAKFELFAQSMPIIIWVSLPDDRIDWFNARLLEYCGIPAPDLGADIWTAVHPEDAATAKILWREILASGKPYATEYRLRRHDGVYRWHIARALPIRGADGAIILWIGTCTDIQDQKSSEQALADLNATLEHLVVERTAELLAAEASLRQSQKMEAVGQLTGGLAHDFNNLLTGISGSLELMALRLDQGKVTDLGRYLNIAQEAAKRAAALTHRLLAFSRRQTLDPKRTDINHLDDGMDELIRRTVGPAGNVENIRSQKLWAVLADPNQLENALLNLCINARDAMPDGGSLIIETSNRRLDESEAKGLELRSAEYVLLSVADSGGGMSADVVERAFEPFFTTKPIGEGTGLGLSMVYGFARQSGGQAKIYSKPGQGTKVCIYLPRYRGGDSVSEPAVSARKAQRSVGETVLLVDDELSVRVLVKEVLEELGYDVLEAENGVSGMQILESSRRVDLLITDVGLPGGINGRQLADAALVIRPSLKVLFITGYAEKAAIGDGQLKPAMHILTKPFSFETLGQRIREIMTAVD